MSRHITSEKTLSTLTDIDESEFELFKSANRRGSLPTLSDTRWLSRVDSLSTLLVNYEKLIDALEEIVAESHGQSQHDVKSYAYSLASFPYIVSAVITQYVLGFTAPLSLQLQAKSCNLVKAHSEARSLLRVLENVRNDDKYYRKMYTRSEDIAKSVNVEPTTPRLAARQKHRANVGATCSINSYDYYKINYFYPFIDHVISYLNTRFDKTLISALRATYLIPSHLDRLTTSIETEIYDEFYNDRDSPEQFSQELIK